MGHRIGRAAGGGRWLRRWAGVVLGLLLAWVLAWPSPLGAQGMGSQTWLQQGQQRYEAGDYAAAAAALHQAQAVATEPAQQVAIALNLALTYHHLGQWPAAAASLDQARQRLAAGLLPQASALQGRLHEVQGQLDLAQGREQAALRAWRQASQVYEQAGRAGDRYRSELQQVEALQSLGHYREALQQLVALNPPLYAQPDPALKAAGLHQLGRVVRVMGDEQGPPAYWQQWSALLQDAGNYLDKAARFLAESERLWGSLHPAARWAVVLDQAVVQETQYYQQKDFAERATYGLDDPENQDGGWPEQLALLAAAWQQYQLVQEQAPEPLIRLQARLKALDVVLAVRQRRDEPLKHPPTLAAAQLLAAASQPLPVAAVQAELASLPRSRPALFARLKWVRQWLESGEAQDAAILDTLVTTLAQAEELGDRRAIAYAQGYRGRWYERQGNWPQAQPWTAAASLTAEELKAPELSYEWAWQLGRILAAQGQDQGAIAAYEVAIKHLDTLRAQLLGSGNPDLQFLFRDRVEPVYRELLALLLPAGAADLPLGKELGEGEVAAPPAQQRLQRAREVVAALQVAELEDFLRCQLRVQNPIALDRYSDQGGAKAAILYPLVMGDRLALIAKLPHQEALVYRPSPHAHAAQELEQAILELRQAIEDRKTAASAPQAFRQGYDYLIAPLEASLAAQDVDTLVFVLDSNLRNIPLAALYNAKTEQYLIERYKLVLNLGLEVPQRPPLNVAKAAILAAGVSVENCTPQACQTPLPHVETELDAIRQQLPQAIILAEQDFTRATLRKFLQQQPFPVVHLATHGTFSSDPQKTQLFPYQEALNLQELSQLLQDQGDRQPQPIELLVLSACETAVGDRRAALGLAGVAIQSGASSTLASLFSVDDRATADLMANFYQALAQPGVDKAAALQQAQLALLRTHPTPYFWAPYLLIGNWH